MTTALERYALLEAQGTWFDGRSARPRAVAVKFGEATLTLLGPGDVPLAHWALASLRAVPDQGARGTLVLVPAQDSEERLTLDDPDMIAAIRAVCPDLTRLKAPRGTARRVLLWAGGAVGSVLLIVFVLIPMLSERLATMIPPAREAALGREVIVQIRQVLSRFGEPIPVCDAPAGRAALDRMLARLEPHAGSHVPITLSVFDHPMVNAFAVPGGQVVLMRGLIEKAESPEEVAGVLAHEIGHVINRDPTRLTLRAAGSAGLLGLLVGDVRGGTAIAVMTDALISASYTREAEAMADQAAHRIMTGAGLPLEPFAGFFLRLAREARRGPGLLSHLATHPDLNARAEEARQADRWGGTPFLPVISDNDWVALRGICER
jgi:beta-barrel assembly-enhancing protease